MIHSTPPNRPVAVQDFSDLRVQYYREKKSWLPWGEPRDEYIYLEEATKRWNSGANDVKVGIDGKRYPVPGIREARALQQVQSYSAARVEGAPAPAFHMRQLMAAGLSLSGLAAYPAYLSLAAGSTLTFQLQGRPAARLTGTESDQEICETLVQSQSLKEALENQVIEPGLALLASYDADRRLSLNPLEELTKLQDPVALQSSSLKDGVTPTMLTSFCQLLQRTAALPPDQQRQWLALVAPSRSRVPLEDRVKLLLDTQALVGPPAAQAEQVLEQAVEQRRQAQADRVSDCQEAARTLGLDIREHIAIRRQTWQEARWSDEQIDAELKLVRTVGFQSPAHLATLKALEPFHLSLDTQARLVNGLAQPEELQHFLETGCLDSWPSAGWAERRALLPNEEASALQILEAYQRYCAIQPRQQVVADLSGAVEILGNTFAGDSVTRLSACQNAQNSQGFLLLARMVSSARWSNVQEQVEMESLVAAGPADLSYDERARALEGCGLLQHHELFQKKGVRAALWSTFAQEMSSGASQQVASERIRGLCDDLKTLKPSEETPPALDYIKTYTARLIGASATTRNFYRECLRQGADPEGAASLALSLPGDAETSEALANSYRKIITTQGKTEAYLTAALAISSLLQKGHDLQQARQLVDLVLSPLNRSDESRRRDHVYLSLKGLNQIKDLSFLGPAQVLTSKGLMIHDALAVTEILSNHAEPVSIKERLNGFVTLNQNNKIDNRTLARALMAELKFGNEPAASLKRLKAVVASTSNMTEAGRATQVVEDYIRLAGSLNATGMEEIVKSGALPWVLSLLGGHGSLAEILAYARELKLLDSASLASRADCCATLADEFKKLLSAGKSKTEAVGMLGVVMASLESKRTTGQEAPAAIREAIALAIPAPSTVAQMVESETEVVVGGIKIKKKRPAQQPPA